jgi:hypothetical protein
LHLTKWSVYENYEPLCYSEKSLLSFIFVLSSKS